MPRHESIPSEIEKLREDIRRHDYAYYVLNEPVLSDTQYDGLLRRLQEIESTHPDLITPDSPTQRVSGSPLASFEQLRHKVPMLSLDNSYSEEEIQQWLDRITKILDTKNIVFVLNPKIDGLSLSLHYKKGDLFQAATRGDGQIGENVTLNARTIRSI
ncbi:DNA ligase (NAD(+)) LigA, partial [bacterium F11]